VNAIVCVLAAILGILFWILWSHSRSRFEAGRRRGIEEAVRELQHGLQSVLDPQAPTPEIAKAEKDFLAALRGWSPPRLGTDQLHANIWVLGGALGDACWIKGHAAGVRRKTPAEGKVRVDLSLVELLQLAGLANLGFQHMMPNARLLQIRRFVGEDDAIDAARAVAKIEGVIPKEHRPDLLRQVASREQLITDWWRPTIGKNIA
jgi:hypothetical protein